MNRTTFERRLEVTSFFARDVRLSIDREEPPQSGSSLVVNVALDDVPVVAAQLRDMAQALEAASR